MSIRVREDLIESFERYMRDQHIPDLMRTGCFSDHEFQKEDDSSYRVVYFLQDRSKWEEYESKFAPELRDDFVKHFPDGIRVERKIVER